MVNRCRTKPEQTSDRKIIDVQNSALAIFCFSRCIIDQERFFFYNLVVLFKADVIPSTVVSKMEVLLT